MRIYVAGPYSAPTLEERITNANSAIDAGLALMEKGHSPFIPHLSHYADERALDTQGSRRTWADWMKLDLDFLEQCEGLLFLAPSFGANIELRRAREMGKLVFYSLEDVPRHVI